MIHMLILQECLPDLLKMVHIHDHSNTKSVLLVSHSRDLQVCGLNARMCIFCILWRTLKCDKNTNGIYDKTFNCETDMG